MGKLRHLSFLLLSLPAFSVRADEVRVAVASNFLHPLQVLSQAFQTETGHRLKISSGSTGSLYAQIRNGAPYQIFLAADGERPALLGGRTFTYALGRLALYSSRAAVSPKEKLVSGDYERLAVANPKTAPYGKAAMEVLGNLDVQPGTLVRGENVGQTLQYLVTGNVELGFVALSQVRQLDGGSSWEVPPSLHGPIRQKAVILSDASAVQAFADFLQREETKGLIRSFGYGTE